MSSLLLSSSHALRLLARRPAPLQQLVGGLSLTNPTTTSTISTQQHCCWMSSNKNGNNKKRAINGSRGTRGHGWYLKYRQGRGGRHLQGEYWDRREHHWDMQQWNDAVVGLGSQFVYLDVAVEPPAAASGGAASASSAPVVAEEKEEHEEIDIDVSATAVDEDNDTEDHAASEKEDTKSATETATEASPVIAAETTNASTTTTEAATPEPLRTERLIIQIASTVMPETCINFIGLCQDAAYNGTILYRIEKQVGICGGDVLSNTGKTGQCWQDFPYERSQPALKPSPLRRDLPPPSEEPLAMWHTAGTVAMLCPKVNEIDSRFILCGHDAPHLDGIHRAFGTLDAASLATVQEWQETVLTAYGQPKSVTLRIVGCGVLEDYQGTSTSSETTPVQAKETA